MVFCEWLWQYCVFKPHGNFSGESSKNSHICEFLAFPPCFGSFFCARFDHSSGTQHILVLNQIFFGRHKFRSLHQSAAFVRIVIPISSIFNILEHKAKCDIQLCSTFELLEHCVKFLVVQSVCIQYLYGKIGKSKSPVLHFRIYKKKLACLQFLLCAFSSI